MSKIDKQAAYTKPFDWRPALLLGVEMAAENNRLYHEPEAWQAMWELLCDAARVSKASEGPPRSDYPETTWPDAPDEITPWQRQMAYLRGDLDEVPEDEPLPPTPTAAEVTRADAVLDLWHRYALWRGSYPHPCKRYIYRMAEGAPLGEVSRISGLPRHEVIAMRRRAAMEMLRAAGVW